MEVDLGNGITLSNWGDSTPLMTQVLPGVGPVVRVRGFGIDSSGTPYFDLDPDSIPPSEVAYLAYDTDGSLQVVK